MSFHINRIGVRNGRTIRRRQFLRGAPLFQIDMVFRTIQMDVAEIHIRWIEGVCDGDDAVVRRLVGDLPMALWLLCILAPYL